MSELKARTARSIADEEEMLELGADCPVESAQVYLKSEADRYIGELKGTIAQLEDDVAFWRSDARRRYSKGRLHDKYKRCLAMAEWCEATALWCYQAANTLPAGFHATLYGKPVMIEPSRLFKRFELLSKWNRRWMKLAEKFKEAR